MRLTTGHPKALVAVLLFSLAGCGRTSAAPAPLPSATAAAAAASSAPAAAAPSAVAGTVLTSRPLPLPGVTGTAFLDYLTYDGATSRVWVPVGATGTVAVLDTASGTFTRVDGFKTEEREVRGKKRTFGPSAAAVGDGVVYVGDRATSEICPVDEKTLKPGKCLKLGAQTDGVSYVAAAKEVWVMTPKDPDRSITVLDASKPGALATKTVIKMDGAPEGAAYDAAHGLFYTNYEDKDRTVAIDVATHQIKSTWDTGCGGDGPRGLSVDSARRWVIVGCTDHLQVLDAAHDGARLGRLDTGDGIDNIDYAPAHRLVYAAAAKAQRLTVASVDDAGNLAVVATGVTSDGARNAVADANGNVYVGDTLGGRLLVFAAPQH
jgi:DNA-binding beta-propeller fold protein YncE